MTDATTTPLRIYWPVGLSRDMPGRSSRADLMEAALYDYVARFMQPGSQVTIGWMKRTTSVLWSIYLGSINDVYVIRAILDAERDGFAAAIVGGHWDPGLYAAREAAGIPVAGPGESAMMMAKTLGRKFAFLTVGEGYVPVIERNIALYGCTSHAIAHRPVRRFDMTFAALAESLEGTSDRFLTAFERAARDCIADGADVIISGGQLFGPVFVKHGFHDIPGTGVPVIDVSACGLKMAETMATLRRTIGLRKSEHVNAPFRTPDRDVVEGVFRDFGLRTERA